MCPAVVDLVSGVVMPNSVVSLFVVGLILSAMSVFGDGDAEMKKLVEDTKSYREAAQKRFGAAPKAIEAFSATIKNVNLALARNKSTVDINSRDKDHAACPSFHADARGREQHILRAHQGPGLRERTARGPTMNAGAETRRQRAPMPS